MAGRGIEPQQRPTQPKRRAAAFGSTANRFSMASIHPQNRTPGSYLQVAYVSPDDPSCFLGPARYNIEKGGFALDAVEERAQGPGWSEQMETALDAAAPRYTVADAHRKQKMLDDSMGPGKYPVADFIDISANKKAGKRDSVFERTSKRFARHDFRDSLPGPGAHGNVHEVPSTQKKKSFAVNGLMTGCAARKTMVGIKSRAATGNDLNLTNGSNRYNIKRFPDTHFPTPGPKRGYCDLSTSQKNGPIKYGYFAHPRRIDVGPGQYPFRAFTDELSGTSNEKKGEVSKCDWATQPPTQRIEVSYLPQTLHPPSYPAPNVYQSAQSMPRSKSAPLEAPLDAAARRRKKFVLDGKPVFNSSSSRDDVVAQRCFHTSPYTFSVARDDINAYHEARYVNGHTHVFNSKHARLRQADNAHDALKRERLETKNSTLTSRKPLVED